MHTSIQLVSVEEECGRANWTSSRATPRLRRGALRGRQRPAGPLAADLDYIREWVFPGPIISIRGHWPQGIQPKRSIISG